MKTKIIVISAFLFSLLLSCSTCDIFRDIESDDFTIDTLTHSGFDFSLGNVPSDVNYLLSDGETINWCPDTQNPNPNYTNWDKWNWWRTSDFSTEYQKNYGNVDLNTISSAPDVWDNVIDPLLKDNCYVVKCNDGYAKFKVLSVGFHDFDVEVKYQFSDTKNF